MAEKLQALWTRLGIPADYARTRHLPRQREARGLVAIGRKRDGCIVRLAPRAAQAWRKMRAAAAGDGIGLLPVSGFRSIARQTRIIRANLAKGRPLDDLLRFVAAPGCSEHHTGRAIDIASARHPDLDAGFARTREFKWLNRHARRFGFRLSYPRDNRHGIGYEPWHWCWYQ